MDVARALSVMAEHLGVPVELLKEQAEFRRDLGADSLDMVELVMALENNLSVVISEDDADRCRTVGDAIALLQQCGRERAEPA